MSKYRTYGELYRGLCEVTGEIPIAIYRTERRKHLNDVEDVCVVCREFLKTICRLKKYLLICG